MKLRPQTLESLAAGSTVLLLVLAPVPIGGRLWEAHPLWWLVTTVMLGACVAHSLASGRALRVGAFPVVLFGLAVFTMLQSIDIGGLLAVLSPRAARIRELTLGSAAGPLSYEPAESALEAMKLAAYAAVAVAVPYWTRHRSNDPVLRAVVAGGLVTLVLGLLHALVGWKGLFGIWDTHQDVGQLLATFANPNHAAGYLMVSGFCALALAVAGRRSEPGMAMLACALFGASLYQRSTGATIALLAGLGGTAAAVFLSRRQQNSGHPEAPGVRAVALRVAGAAGLATAGVLGAEAVVDGFSQSTLEEKVAAFENAPALIGDHLWLGIGRGAYRSVYSGYLESPLRVIHTHPEVLPVQLVSEWGVVLGAAAFFAFMGLLTVRLLGASRLKDRIVLCGVGALVIQNLADFSLEITGVALTAVALVAAVKSRQVVLLRLRRPVAKIGFACGVVLLGAVGLLRSAQVGDLRAHAATFERALDASAESPPSEGAGQVEALTELARRHPANAFGWLALAKAQAQKTPPDLSGALVSTNKAIALAPTHASPRALSGLILWRGGLRDQAVLELRRAWELAPNPVQLAERWVRWFESPRQMAEAMPRAAGALGGPDLGTVVRVLPLVRSARGDGFARELLSSVPADAPANPRERLRIARLAGSLGALEQAVDVLRELVREPEASQKAVLSALELLRDLDRSDLALSWIDDWQVRQGHRELPQRFCLFRASVALDQGEPREAAETLDGCSQSRSKPPSANPKWVRLRARADAEAGDPRAALSRLDDLFQQFPHDLALRRERALYLLESGRTAEARLEANYVLRRSPEDGRARAVLRELDRMRRAGTAP